MNMEHLYQMAQLFAAFLMGVGMMNLLGASVIAILFGTKDPDYRSRINRMYLASCANTLLGIALKLMTM